MSELLGSRLVSYHTDGICPTLGFGTLRGPIENGFLVIKDIRENHTRPGNITNGNASGRILTVPPDPLCILSSEAGFTMARSEHEPSVEIGARVIVDRDSKNIQKIARLVKQSFYFRHMGVPEELSQMPDDQIVRTFLSPELIAELQASCNFLLSPQSLYWSNDDQKYILIDPETIYFSPLFKHRISKQLIDTRGRPVGSIRTNLSGDHRFFEIKGPELTTVLKVRAGETRRVALDTWIGFSFDDKYGGLTRERLLEFDKFFRGDVPNERQLRELLDPYIRIA